MIRRLTVLALCASLLFGGTSLWAQQPADPMGEALFPPELVMQHQRAIGLSEEQKQFIIGEIKKAQTRFTELQWQLQSEMETMAGLAKPGRVDEQKILAQLDKTLNVEREIKRTHISLIVRIKNTLTAEQLGRLQEIKSKLRGK